MFLMPATRSRIGGRSRRQFGYQLVGTANSDVAAAGNVGQYLESEILIGSAVALTNTIASTVTSLVLTPGSWVVQGNVVFTGNPATAVTFNIAAVTTIAANLGVAPNKGATAVQAATVGAHWAGNAQPAGLPTGERIIFASVATPVFLIGYSEFTVSTQSAYGTVWARRFR